MEEFNIEKTPDGDLLTVNRRGSDLLRFPLYNKGTAFTPDERRALGIEGLLPAAYNDIDAQARRIFRSIFYNKDDVSRHIGLASLQDRNEVLFYKVLRENLRDVMPIVYTPTVGKASQHYSRVFRRTRGVFITPDHAGRIEDILRKSAPFAGVRLMVVTDNEAILGIGDQGAGGMAISVGKLALYCVGAGIHPARTLPVSLDVGTDNEALLEDPGYLGYREKRLRGDAYVALLDEFVEAAHKVFPNVVIQWEDFRKDNALRVLERYRNEVPSFNDDIQGTGAVATACVVGACRVSGRDFAESRVLIYGAGAAGIGIFRQLRQRLRAAGVDGEALARAMLVMDSRGVISDGRSSLDEYKKEMAWPEDWYASLGLAEDARNDLAAVARAYGATALIGTSGQGGSFDQDVVAAMAENTGEPVILPMSNPTSISEAHPADVVRWTGNRALIATGSPFEPVPLGGGGEQRIGQANNVFVFPGVGLGAIACDAGEITGTMISAAAQALAANLSDEDIAERAIVPRTARLWDICGSVARAVAEQAVADGVAGVDKDLDARIEDLRWLPVYPKIVSTAK